MTDETWVPNDETLIAELKLVRQKGLGELQRMSLPELTLVATALNPEHPSIKKVIRVAVERLSGKARDAAEYDFGLVEGAELWQSSERRARAAEIYGITPGSFRKKPERLVIEQIALEMRGLVVDASRKVSRKPKEARDPTEDPPNSLDREIGTAENPLRVEIANPGSAANGATDESRFGQMLRWQKIAVVAGACAVLISPLVPVIYSSVRQGEDNVGSSPGPEVTSSTQVIPASSDPELMKYTLVYRSPENGVLVTDSLSGNASRSTFISSSLQSVAYGFAFIPEDEGRDLAYRESKGIAMVDILSGSKNYLTDPPSYGTLDMDEFSQEGSGTRTIFSDISAAYARDAGRVFFIRQSAQWEWSHGDVTRAEGPPRELRSIGINRDKSTERKEEVPFQFLTLSVDDKGEIVVGSCIGLPSGQRGTCWANLSTGESGPIPIPDYIRELKSASVSPDGEWIVADVAEKHGSRHGSIYLYSLKGNEWRKVVDLATDLWCEINWASGTSSADYFVFSQRIRGDGLNDIYVYRMSDGAVLKSDVLGESPHLTKY